MGTASPLKRSPQPIRGKRYLQITVKDETKEPTDRGPTLSPDILESRVSVSFADSLSGDDLDSWLTTLSNERESAQRVTQQLKEKASAPALSCDPSTLWQRGTDMSALRIQQGWIQ
ncbi:hypothetical protein LTR28_002864 [Elasticomyces elasticus]|nr:hypothetical protein LTR28_002864 [Elasticomyces elasticus]